MSEPPTTVRRLVEDIRPFDRQEDADRAAVLGWLNETDDVFRRAKPRTPPQHLVSYFLLVDPVGPQILLVDHRKSGLWLPAGGHVEPGESPVDTVRREVAEELGIAASFPAWLGEKAFFLTVTETVGDPSVRHVDVSLWFVLQGDRRQALTPDPGEFRAVRWWTPQEVTEADPAIFDPHLGRMLAKLAEAIPAQPGRETPAARS
ncbi:NUDIX hydrolase [Oryzihumus leptocrescens]|uniref:ADP-ribose pyrophosphatase YjhB (NUDIX family) n=1 Tax=Oryzihumus leptocrescens TaxID=297536 RepID=A0A542Z7P4_9MICO|nr:NUDIX domain-containing protein [Oryzihumus leptocrescens]TQL56366.1 ADP-ribose pyrophosphatase YjhB (NUDIX family) [Oryzihumus leptocrescens]